MTERKDHKAAWVPDNAGAEFATNVMGGVKGGHDGLGHRGGLSPYREQQIVKRPKLDKDGYVDGVLSQNRGLLSRAITLIESNNKRHMDMSQEVLKDLLPKAGKSMRIGITGVPGAGKSTFIEAFGLMLCDMGYKVAVLAVDPSSTVTKGSILGDKTRMEKLARHENAFIRPSPSGGTLGGVTRKTRETIIACEAAGYDVILVETVGVGQSEVTVRSLVDFFMLVVITGAGDELQGMKKGVMELADAIVVNKADGDNKTKAEISKVDYERILHYLRPATVGWETKAFAVSALTGYNIPYLWKVIQKFQEITRESGVFQRRRKKQTLDWMYAMVREHLETIFFNNPSVKYKIPLIEQSVVMGELSATMAVTELLNTYENAIK